MCCASGGGRRSPRRPPRPPPTDSDAARVGHHRPRLHRGRNRAVRLWPARHPERAPRRRLALPRALAGFRRKARVRRAGQGVRVVRGAHRGRGSPGGVRRDAAPGPEGALPRVRGGREARDRREAAVRDGQGRGGGHRRLQVPQPRLPRRHALGAPPPHRPPPRTLAGPVVRPRLGRRRRLPDRAAGQGGAGPVRRRGRAAGCAGGPGVVSDPCDPVCFREPGTGEGHRRRHPHHRVQPRPGLHLRHHLVSRAPRPGRHPDGAHRPVLGILHLDLRPELHHPLGQGDPRARRFRAPLALHHAPGHVPEPRLPDRLPPRQAVRRRPRDRRTPRKGCRRRGLRRAVPQVRLAGGTGCHRGRRDGGVPEGGRAHPRGLRGVSREREEGRGGGFAEGRHQGVAVSGRARGGARRRSCGSGVARICGQ